MSKRTSPARGAAVLDDLYEYFKAMGPEKAR
jgi:hypothetical protein